MQICEIWLPKTVTLSFKNLPGKLSRPPFLFWFKSLRSFNTVYSDTKVKWHLELKCFRNKGKLNLKGEEKLASISSSSVKKDFLKMEAFFWIKLVTLSFVLRQMFVKGLLIEVEHRVLRDFYNSEFHNLDLPMFSVNFIIKNLIFFCSIHFWVLHFASI